MEMRKFGRNELKILLIKLFNNITDKNPKPQQWETRLEINLHKKKRNKNQI